MELSFYFGYPQDIVREAKSYSIIDHELLHGGYLARLSHRALALYLFLTVVGDRDGKSFYSDSSIGSILRMDPGQLLDAANDLIQDGLIAHQKPHWHVNTLTWSRKSPNNQSGIISLEPFVNKIIKNKEL